MKGSDYVEDFLSVRNHWDRLCEPSNLLLNG